MKGSFADSDHIMIEFMIVRKKRKDSSRLKMLVFSKADLYRLLILWGKEVQERSVYLRDNTKVTRTCYLDAKERYQQETSLAVQ